jgi:hypothetical protein
MPRKVFTAGEILTAADVNTNLMDQAVMVFDDAAARTTAIPSPIEGMVTYLKDTDSLDKYDGSNFVPVDTGGLVAVKSATKTDTFSSSVAAQANVEVTGLSITHEVANSANKLIMMAFFGAAASNVNEGNVGIAISDGTNLLSIADSAGNRTRVTAGGGVSTAAAHVVTMPHITIVHTPGAGSKTYTVRAINIRGTTQTLVVNRTTDDGDVANNVRAVSAFHIFEVAV